MKIIKDICKWLVIGGIFAIPFIPFVVPSAMFFPFISGKGFTFRILIEVMFGLYALLAISEPEYRPKLTWITKSIGAFILIIFVADLFGANAYKSLWSNYERMEGFVLIAHLALYYIVVSSVLRTSSLWNWFLNTSIVASTIMSFYGLMQIIGTTSWGSFAISAAKHFPINQGGVRLDGTFGNASYFAIYLVFHIFLCLYMLVSAYTPKWQKWVYGCIAVFETVILYFTATRGAILGLIGGLILSAILIAWKEKQNTQMRKLAYTLLIIMAVGILGFIGIRNTAFVRQSPVLSRFASINKEEITSQGRYFVWPMALKGIKERPIIGWGQENFNYVFNKYYNPEMYAQEQWFDRTHNTVLDWMIAGGILGFLAYASMYVTLLYYVWRKESTLSISEKSIFTGMISAYVFHNMFVFDNLISYIMFFSLLAYVHSRSVVNVQLRSTFSRARVSEDVLMYVALPVVVIVTVVVVYFINIPALSANQTLIKAITPQQTGGVEKNLELFKKVFAYNSFGNDEATEQLVQVATQIYGAQQIPDTLKKEFLDYASQKISEKVTKTPNDARYFVFGGSFFNRVGQYDESLKYLNRAIELSPNKQSIYFEIGTSYIGKKDFPKALEIFKKGYDLEPASGEARIVYAIGAMYAHDKTLFSTLVSGIPQNTIFTDNRFLRAYADIGEFQTVITILTKRLESDPTNMQYKLSLASTYNQMGQKQKAIDVLHDMIAQDPTFKDQGEQYIKLIQSQ